MKELRKEIRIVLVVLILVVLLTCAFLMPGLYEVERVMLLLAAAVTVWIHNACECMLQKAETPIVIRDETPEEKTKPPEQREE